MCDDVDCESGAALVSSVRLQRCYFASAATNVAQYDRLMIENMK